MPVTRDETLHHVEITCDGKPTALGCMVAISVTRPTRDQCYVEILRQGWLVPFNNRILCPLCLRREYPGPKKAQPSAQEKDLSNARTDHRH